MTYAGGESLIKPVRVEVTTSSYRVHGTVRTRFDRVASVLNNLDLSHLTVELATVTELYDAARGRRAESVLVPLDEILFMVAAMPEERTTEQIIVPKHPVGAQLGLPPFHLEGTIFVSESVASASVAITMTPDTFVPMVDVEVSCWIREELNAVYPVLAFHRHRVHVMSFSENGRDPLTDLRPAIDPG
ncbi:MAG TPA: hypothetical protein VI277_06175 [Candidatus Limnocylindria bacterium]